MSLEHLLTLVLIEEILSCDAHLVRIAGESLLIHGDHFRFGVNPCRIQLVLLGQRVVLIRYPLQVGVFWRTAQLIFLDRMQGILNLSSQNNFVSGVMAFCRIALHFIYLV
jgi:hypothetical protein